MIFIIGADRQVPPSSCTNCGKVMDGATCIGADSAPEPGDASVCLNCGHIMAYGDDLKMRNLTDAEVVLFAGNPAIIAIQRARERFKK